LRARDLILECFVDAQHEAMTRNWAYQDEDRNPNVIRLGAQNALRSAFRRTGGDYDNPDKASLTRLARSLADAARETDAARDIVEHLAGQIAAILAELPD
jgi:hypothetical protein